MLPVEKNIEHVLTSSHWCLHETVRPHCAPCVGHTGYFCCCFFSKYRRLSRPYSSLKMVPSRSSILLSTNSFALCIVQEKGSLSAWALTETSTEHKHHALQVARQIDSEVSKFSGTCHGDASAEFQAENPLSPCNAFTIIQTEPKPQSHRLNSDIDVTNCLLPHEAPGLTETASGDAMHDHVRQQQPGVAVEPSWSEAAQPSTPEQPGMPLCEIDTCPPVLTHTNCKAFENTGGSQCLLSHSGMAFHMLISQASATDTNTGPEALDHLHTSNLSCHGSGGQSEKSATWLSD